LQADPIHLKSFLSVVNAAVNGKVTDAMLVSLVAPSANKLSEKLKTRITISSRKDYPVTSGFPSCLETLTVQTCGLKRFDERMLALRRLHVLELNDNYLTDLPDNFDCVPHLNSLKLSNNRIADIPAGFCTSNLSKSLTQLDLSHNCLTELPHQFYALQQLVVLKLDNNKLTCLSYGLRKMKRLQTLSLSHNQLCSLPDDVVQIRLQNIDLFDNPLCGNPALCNVDEMTFGVSSLFELSLRVVRKAKLVHVCNCFTAVLAVLPID
jgi:LRR-repeat protein 1